MEVIPTPIENFSGIVKYKRGEQYPISPPEAHLPQLYGLYAFCGGRNSGKTAACARILKQAEIYGYTDRTSGKKCGQRIILMSPTAVQNLVWGALKYLDPSDIHEEYSDAILESVVSDIKSEKAETDAYIAKVALWKEMKTIRKIEDLTVEMERLLTETDGDFDNIEKPRYPTRTVVHLILDDLSASGAYTNKAKSYLTQFSLRNRHEGVNIYFLIQAFKSIPKTIRCNLSCIILFKFASKKVLLDDLQVELSRVLTPAQFEALYDFAVDNPVHKGHGFLMADLTAGVPKAERFRSGFDYFIRLGSK